MSDEEPPDDREPNEDELGQPIDELGRLRQQPGEEFLDTIHGRISRKVLGVHVVSYVWFVPLAVALEFLKMAFHLVSGDNRRQR